MLNVAGQEQGGLLGQELRVDARLTRCPPRLPLLFMPLPFSRDKLSFSFASATGNPPAILSSRHPLSILHFNHHLPFFSRTLIATAKLMKACQTYFLPARAFHNQLNHFARCHYQWSQWSAPMYSEGSTQHGRVMLLYVIVSGEAHENSRYLDDPVMPQEEEEKKAAEAWLFLPLREALIACCCNPC